MSTAHAVNIIDMETRLKIKAFKMSFFLGDFKQTKIGVLDLEFIA